MKFDCQIKKRFVKLELSSQHLARACCWQRNGHLACDNCCDGWIDFSMSNCKGVQMIFSNSA